jgi:NADPH2:quinone reductase
MNAMHGSHAELVSASARKSWKLPDALTFEAGAVVPIEFGTASDALFEFGRLQFGETVLVHGGAGGVGLAAVQLAAGAGATVIATAGDDGRLERLGDFGVDHVVNYRSDDVAARVMELTGGRGADLIVDPIGGRTLESSIEALAYRGRISWIGNGRREPADVWPLMQKNGMLIPQFFAMEQSRNPDRTRALVDELLAAVARGELRVVVDRVFALDDVAEAHAYAESAHPFGRVVIVPER